MAAKPTPKPPAPAKPGGWITETAAEGTSFIPDIGVSSKAAAVTRVDACPQFQLAFHPKRWMVMGGRVLPSFYKMPLISGLDGVDARIINGATKLVTALARQSREERGWTLIPFDAVPPGHGTSYLYSPKGRRDVTLLIYEVCYPDSAQIDVDVDRYIEFCDHLLATNVITPCPAYTLRAMLESESAAAARLAIQADKDSAFAPDAKRLAGNVEVIKAALVARESELRKAAPVEREAATPDVA